MSQSSKRTDSSSSNSDQLPTITINEEMVDLVGSQIQSQVPHRTGSSVTNRRPITSGYDSLGDDNNKENQPILITRYGSNKRERLSYNTSDPLMGGDSRRGSNKCSGSLGDGIILSSSPSRSTGYRAFEDEEISREISAETIQAQYETEGYNRVVTEQSNIEQNEGVIIDGRFSLSMSVIPGEEDGFVAIDLIGNNDMTTTKALKMCTKYVLGPYHIFLKIIGWRSFTSPRATETQWYRKCCNVLYPTFIFMMLIFTSLSQIGSCFSRTQSDSPPLLNDSTDIRILSCRKDLVSGTVIGDILILIAYLWAFCVYRFSEREHLSKLIQIVFLSCTSKLVHNSPKRLVMVLLTFLVMGICWIGFSFVASLGRIFALKLDEETTYIGWFVHEDGELIKPEKYDGVHYSLIIISMFGFFFFDLLYVAVTINYITQCELLHFYIRNIKEKVKTKDMLLGFAVKELYHVNEYLKILNGKLSYITSLIFFIFVQGVIFSYWSLLDVRQGSYLNIVIGIMNVLQWLTATLVLLIQSTRLTAECNGIRKLGLEIGARPYVYSDTPQLVLDSFVLYTNATNYKAKLAFVPMYPSFVCGFFFVFGLVMTIYPAFTEFDFAVWL